MIYDPVPENEPIRQGDVFLRLPRPEISLASIALIEDDETQSQVEWNEIKDEQKTFTAILPIKAVSAIVITQNCDAVRSAYISLCHIDIFSEVLGESQPTSPKKWQSLITKHARTAMRYFYLPSSTTTGFPERMAVDFRLIFQMQRQDLEQHRDLRAFRLNKMAREHFRESLAQYFRRYPYDEWYPLTKEEFAAYSEQMEPKPQAFRWQEPT